jgi:hypothetical protein
LLRGLHAVADRGEVFLLGRLERDTHMVVPRLRHEADRVGLGVEQRRKPRSFDVERPGLRVMPNAVKVAPMLRFSPNSSVSVGLAPG